MHRKTTSGNPPIHYIWVGPPATSKNDIPGHDILSPLQMVAVNTSNQINYWCLEEHKDHYQKVFAGHPVTVQTIQSFLRDLAKSPNPFFHESAEKIMQIGRITLGWEHPMPSEFKRGNKRDFVSMKNVMSLALASVFGGYILDTNVGPKKGISVLNLPDYMEFKLPEVFDTKDSRTVKVLDFWMMYSPEKHHAPRNSLFYYLHEWSKSEEIFTRNPYSEEYYQYMPHMMISVLKKSPFTCWKAEASTTTLACYLITELDLEKRYFNTHKFLNREDENQRIIVSNNFCLFRKKYLEPHFKNNEVIGNIICDFIDREDATDVLSQTLTYKGDRVNVKGSIQTSEIYKAICENDIERLQELLASGHDINEQRYSDLAIDITPVHFAISLEMVECLKTLLNNNPNLDLEMYRNGVFLTPLELAHKVQNTQILEVIEKHLEAKSTLRIKLP